MALNFPSSPTLNQTFTSGLSTWTWDGVKWAPAGIAGSGYLPLGGGTLSGPLILNADPTVALGAATKEYADAITPAYQTADATVTTNFQAADSVLWQNIRYRNRIINGNMSVDQRNNFNVINVINTTSYVIDRWKCVTNIAAGKGASGAVATNASGLSGYTNYLFWNTNAAAYAVTANDFFMLQQFIEGINFNDANWGTANAQPIVLEFWAMSSLTGTFGGSLRGNGNTRSYVFTYNITVASTWQKFRINIPGDTAGTWAVANNVTALNLTFSIGAGATYTGSIGWQAGSFISTTGAISVVGTLNAFLYITGVAIMVGAAAQNAEPEFKKYSDNLLDCQRYYQIVSKILFSYYAAAAGGANYCSVYFKPTMRAVPTATLGSASNGNVTSVSFIQGGQDSFGLQVTNTAVGNVISNYTNSTFDADL